MVATSHKKEVLEEAERRAEQAFAVTQDDPGGRCPLDPEWLFSFLQNRFCLEMRSHKLSFSAKYP
jgi:hypothetical protein